MAPKSKLILIMAALSLRKKKICALALLVMLDKVENENTGSVKLPKTLLPKHFSFDFYYEMLIPLCHINMGIFVLRLLVVPHLLLPFFQILFFKSFNKNVYFK